MHIPFESLEKYKVWWEVVMFSDVVDLGREKQSVYAIFAFTFLKSE